MKSFLELIQRTKKYSEKNKKLFISNLNTNEVCCHWTGWCCKCLNLILSRGDDLRGFDSSPVIVLRFVSSREVFWCWSLSCSLIVRARFLLSSSAPIHPFGDVTIQLEFSPARLISISRTKQSEPSWSNFCDKTDEFMARLGKVFTAIKSTSTCFHGRLGGRGGTKAK